MQKHMQEIITVAITQTIRRLEPNFKSLFQISFRKVNEKNTNMKTAISGTDQWT
jgi:hypothetical protein